MIERNFIAQKTKEYYLKKYIKNTLSNVGISQIKLKKIPLGEKIMIYTSRPSLVVGSKGANIKDLTRILKKEFQLENPQIEINEVKDIFLDAQLVAEKIAASLERFGSARFKSVGHKIMENVMNSGALGIELVVSGKIPSARAKSWRFYQGYLKKCGELAIVGVRHAQATALLKSGIIGIKVSIMPPDLKLPDYLEVLDHPVMMLEELPAETGKAEKEKKRKKAAKSGKSVPSPTSKPVSKPAAKKKMAKQQLGEDQKKAPGELPAELPTIEQSPSSLKQPEEPTVAPAGAPEITPETVPVAVLSEEGER